MPPLQHSIVLWSKLDDMRMGWPVMEQAYPELTLDIYCSRLSQALLLGYKQFASIDEKHQCRGVLGLWLFPKLWCGLQAEIDNFVVDNQYRSQGIGKQLLKYSLEFARNQGAELALLATFVHNSASHKFYFREGFNIHAYHFIKPLSSTAE